MGVKIKEAIMKQIKEILDEYNQFNANYRRVIFPSSEEYATVYKMILKAKTLILRQFEGTEYHKQVSVFSTRIDKHGLNMVMSVLLTLYENLEKDYESLKKPQKIELKYEKIIEVNLSDKIYDEIIAEINGTYIYHYFASMYIMIRKLLEKLLYDCLKAFYKSQDVEKYYNTGKNQHQGYGVLIHNFNQMIKDTEFKIYKKLGFKTFTKAIEAAKGEFSRKVKIKKDSIIF